MTNRTIPETEETYGQRASEILRTWYEAQGEIARSSETVEGPHASLLTDAQRAAAAREQKAERARAEAESYRREYRELTEERNAAVRARTRSLHKELYAVESADVLSRAALATDAQLGAMTELAATTGNAELAKAAFVVAEQRQLGEVMGAYFDRTNPKARELYEEWRAAPTEEVLERRLSDADKLFAAPTPADFAPVLGMQI